MYDLIPPNMKAQFNSINLPNQSIKLNVYLENKSSNKKGLSNYTYNKITIFKYIINIQNSQINLNIFTKNSDRPFLFDDLLKRFTFNLIL